MEKDTLGNGKKKLSGKWIALVVIVCAIVAACAVLLGLYYGTLQDPLDLMEIPVIELPVSYRTTVARTDAYLNGSVNAAAAGNAADIADIMETVCAISPPRPLPTDVMNPKTSDSSINNGAA